MLLLTTAAAAVTRVAKKTHLKKDPELSFDLMLRGSKHFYFILAKTTNEWHMVLQHSSTSSRWFCPVPSLEVNGWCYLQQPCCCHLIILFLKICGQDPHISRKEICTNIQGQSGGGVRATYWSYCSSRRAGMCERPFLEDSSSSSHWGRLVCIGT